MALLDIGRLMRAAGQTIQGLPENAGVMGGLSLLSANQPGQRNPVDQPGSFLKGMLQANSLKQNRLALEEAAKEKARQEAMAVKQQEFYNNLAMQRQNQAMQMQAQQQIGQMQTPFNPADMRATLPADMQARSIGDAGQQTPIHAAPPIQIPAMNPMEMALASGVPAIQGKAFEEMLEQNKNSGDLGLNDATPSNYTPASIARFIELKQQGKEQEAFAQLVPIGADKRIVKDGRTYIASLDSEGKYDLTNLTPDPGDPQFIANQQLVTGARATLEATEELTNTNMDDINLLVNSLAGSAVGEWFGTTKSKAPGSEEADWYNIYDKVKSSTFLAGRDMLKGGGTITDYEGAMAQQALNGMNIATSKKAFIEDSRKYQKYLLRGYYKMQYVATNEDFSAGRTGGVIPKSVKDEINAKVDAQMKSYESVYDKASYQAAPTGIGTINNGTEDETFDATVGDT